MSTEDWLEEQLKTIKNLAEIAILLKQLDKTSLLPTVLEFLFEESQNILDENCIEDE